MTDEKMMYAPAAKEGYCVHEPESGVLKRLGVRGVIRLHADDFTHLHPGSTKDTHQGFFHFFYQKSDTFVGHTYAAVPIIGRAQGNRIIPETADNIPTNQPVLGIDSHVRLFASMAINNVAYDQINGDAIAARDDGIGKPRSYTHWDFSLPDMKTPEQVLDKIVERYAPFHPGVSRDQMRENGLGIALFKVLH